MKSTFAFIALFLAVSLACPAFALAEENALPTGLNYLCADGFLYYNLPSDDKPTLNRIRPDGTDAQKLLDGSGNRLTIWEGKLYFVKDKDLCRMNTDGSGFEVVGAGISDGWNLSGLYITGDYVYARADGKIVRYTLNPWKLDLEIKLPIRFDSHFQIADGWIYLADAFGTNAVPEGGKFYRVRTDGTQNAAWFEPTLPYGRTILYWSVAGEWLYYSVIDYTGGRVEFRRVGLDGTGDTLVLSGLNVLFFDGKWAYGQVPTSGDEDSYFSFDSETLWRGSITGGALECLGNYPVHALSMVDGGFVYDDFSESGKITLYDRDMRSGLVLTAAKS